MTMKESVWRGVILSTMATVSLTFMNILVKLISPFIPVYEIIWARFFISSILIFPIMLSLGRFVFKIEHFIKLLLRTIYALIGMALLFMSLRELPLTQAALLANTTPLIVPILAFLMTHVKTSKLGVMGIIIGFIGVGIVLDIHHATLGRGALFAICAAFFAALTIIQLREIGKTIGTWYMLFYYFFMSTVLISPLLLFKMTVPHENRIILYLILIGLIGFVYQICSTLSYKLAPVHLTTPILYLNVLLSGLFEWLIWNQKPSLAFFIGGLFIISGVLINLFFGNAQQYKQTESFPKQNH